MVVVMVVRELSRWCWWWKSRSCHGGGGGVEVVAMMMIISHFRKVPKRNFI